MEKHNHETQPPAPPAAPPPEPYPAPGYPKVVFSKTLHVPPVIVNNDAELHALDPKQWTLIPPEKAVKDADTWPKIYGNVNLPPKIVVSAEDAAKLGDGWLEFPLPEGFSQPKGNATKP